MHCERTINRDYVTLLKIKVMKKKSSLSKEIKLNKFLTELSSVPCVSFKVCNSDVSAFRVKIYTLSCIFSQVQLCKIFKIIPAGFHYYMTTDVSDNICLVVYADLIC